MMRTAIYLLLVAILATSAFYVSYLIGYRVAPTLNNMGYEPKGLQHHEKINTVNVRVTEHRFYPCCYHL